jgi:hypothetical protein
LEEGGAEKAPPFFQGQNGMAKDLEEIHARIAAAREESDRLRIDIDAWLIRTFDFKAEPIYFAVLRHPPAEYAIFARQKEQIPTSIVSRVGMVLNELRAPLDSLACQLAIRNGKSTSKVYFPISGSKAAFLDDGLKKISKLSAADQATIQSIEPFREKNPVLFALHDIDRVRKHVRLAALGAWGGLDIEGFVLISPRATKAHFRESVFNGVRIRDLKFVPTNTDGQIGKFVKVVEYVPESLKAKALPALCFAEPQEVERLPVVEGIQQMANLVNGIVSKFD